MATTPQHAYARRYRKVKHQHDKTPFRTIGHLTIESDFDLTKFRRNLRRKIDFPLYVKIEQSAGAPRPHFHFLTTKVVTKRTFRAIIKKCLQGETFDLKVDPLGEGEANAKIWYLAKNTSYKGRCDFTIGKVFTENTQELCKQTKPEKQRAIKQVALYRDNLLHEYYFHNVIPQHELDNPSFLALWRNFLRYDGSLAQIYEIRLLEYGWPDIDSLKTTKTLIAL